MKVLVTGGAGFIGCNLVNHFLKQGAEVVALDNLFRIGADKNIDWLRSNHSKNLTIVNGDIRKIDDITKATKDADAIFHTAAQVAVTDSLKNPRLDFEINAIGTFNVLEAARLANTDPSVFFTSTNKVYGNNVNNISLAEGEKRHSFSDANFEHGVPETFPADANEHTPYGASKYAADLYVRDCGAVHGMKTVTFRMSCIYGTRQFGNEEQGWVAHFIISSILNKSLTIYGDWKQVRDVLFVEDLVNAFDSALKNINVTRGQVYNIGGGPNNTLSLLELIEKLEGINKQKVNFSFSDWRPFDQKVYISDIRKAKTFGWEPKISVDEGINRLHKWVTDNIHLFK